MQVIATAIFNIGAFLYTGIQIYQMQTLETCLSVDLPTLPPSTVQMDESMCPAPVTPEIYMNSTALLSNLQPLLYAIVAVTGLFNIIGCYVAYKVYLEYGWMIYQIQGAGIVQKSTVSFFF